MNIAVEIADDRWMSIPDVETLVERTVAACIGADNKREVSILLANDKEMQALNKHWRGKDKPTNVLSFPAAAPPSLPAGEVAPLGDIVLAIETVVNEASLSEKPLENHLSHLIVHGILHLLGHDHETDSDAETMEDRERKILEGLGIPDPYVT